MTDKRNEGLDLIDRMIAPEVAKALAGASASPEFGAYLGELAVRNVFGELWTRPGLDLRARSLVTLGVLIALRATEELKVHAPVAVRNGLTVTELQEVLFHTAAYAGFPAASAARGAMLEALRGAKLIP